MKRKELERILQSIPSHPSPEPSLEQYTTPAPLAAEILYIAYFEGDIARKTVIDLGCGTGIFAVGAKLLGAKKSVGVDIDSEAIKIAKKFATQLSLNVNFVVSKVEDYKGKGDTVIQNPPFGAQRRGADIPFVAKALQIAPVVYTLHSSATEKYIAKRMNELAATISFKKQYQFGIKHIFKFHRKEIEHFPVTLFRITRKDGDEAD